MDCRESVAVGTAHPQSRFTQASPGHGGATATIGRRGFFLTAGSRDATWSSTGRRSVPVRKPGMHFTPYRRASVDLAWPRPAFRPERAGRRPPRSRFSRHHHLTGRLARALMPSCQGTGVRSDIQRVHVGGHRLRLGHRGASAGLETISGHSPITWRVSRSKVSSAKLLPRQDLETAVANAHLRGWRRRVLWLPRAGRRGGRSCG